MKTNQRRASVFRRSLSVALDLIVIAVPLQIIVAVLFVMTSGHLQLSQGIILTRCASTDRVPDNLSPPPPADVNSAKDCRVTFFGAQVARTLTVSHANKPIVKTATSSLAVSLGADLINTLVGEPDLDTVAASYMLDREGKPIDGVALDWLAYVALFGYLLLIESRTGRSIGDRVMGIAVIDTATEAVAQRRIPLAKTTVRYVALTFGLIPFADIGAAHGLERWGGYAEFVAMIWYLVILVQVLRRRDPPHDLIAGTAVVEE
jgi:hypothetical protein